MRKRQVPVRYARTWLYFSWIQDRNKVARTVAHSVQYISGSDLMQNGIRVICTVNSRQSILLWNAKASDGITTVQCSLLSLLTLIYHLVRAVLIPPLHCILRSYKFNPVKPSGHCTYRQFNIQQFYVLPTQCVYVFCVDLRTNSDYFPIQH
jgi:hypothetical protein